MLKLIGLLIQTLKLIHLSLLMRLLIRLQILMLKLIGLLIQTLKLIDLSLLMR